MGAALRVVLLAAFMVGQIAAGASVAGIDTWVGNEDNVDLPQGRRLALLVVGLARRGVFENVLRALTLNVVEPVGVTEVDVYVHLEPAVEGENKTFTAAELTECLATLLPAAVVRASVILPAGAGRATLGQRFGGHAAGGWKHHEHHQLQFRSLQELFGMALDQERQAQARYAYVARVRTDTLMLAAWPKVSEDWAALLPPHSVGGPGYATRGHRSDKFYIAPRSSSFRVFMLLPLHFTWRVAATDAWEALGCGEREETEDFILANCDRWGCPRGGGARGCEVCCGDVTWGVGSPLMCPEVLLPVAWQRMGLVLVDACALTGHFAVQGRHHPFEHYCRPLPPSPALADANAEAGGSVSQRTHTWPTRLGSRHPVTAAPPHLALRHAAAILVSRGTRGDDVAGAAVAGAAGVCAGQWVRFDVWMSHLLPGVGYTLVAELEGPGWLLPASTSLTAIQTHAHLFLDLRHGVGDTGGGTSCRVSLYDAFPGADPEEALLARASRPLPPVFSAERCNPPPAPDDAAAARVIDSQQEAEDASGAQDHHSAGASGAAEDYLAETEGGSGTRVRWGVASAQAGGGGGGGREQMAQVLETEVATHGRMLSDYVLPPSR